MFTIEPRHDLTQLCRTWNELSNHVSSPRSVCCDEDVGFWLCETSPQGRVRWRPPLCPPYLLENPAHWKWKTATYITVVTAAQIRFPNRRQLSYLSPSPYYYKRHLIGRRCVVEIGRWGKLRYSSLLQRITVTTFGFLYHSKPFNYKVNSLNCCAVFLSNLSRTHPCWPVVFGSTVRWRTVLSTYPQLIEKEKT